MGWWLETQGEEAARGGGVVFVRVSRRLLAPTVRPWVGRVGWWGGIEGERAARGGFVAFVGVLRRPPPLRGVVGGEGEVAAEEAGQEQVAGLAEVTDSFSECFLRCKHWLN